MYKKNYIFVLMSLFVGMNIVASDNQGLINLQSREIQEEDAPAADQPNLPVVSNNSGNQVQMVVTIPGPPVMPSVQPIRDTGMGAVRSYHTAAIFMSNGPVQNS